MCRVAVCVLYVVLCGCVLYVLCGCVVVGCMCCVVVCCVVVCRCCGCVCGCCGGCMLCCILCALLLVWFVVLQVVYAVCCMCCVVVYWLSGLSLMALTWPNLEGMHQCCTYSPLLDCGCCRQIAKVESPMHSHDRIWNKYPETCLYFSICMLNVAMGVFYLIIMLLLLCSQWAASGMFFDIPFSHFHFLIKTHEISAE